MSTPYHEIENPIRSRPNRRTFRSHAQAVDLGRVQPGHALHANAEENIIQEEKRHGARCNLLLVRVAGFLGIADQDRDDEVAEALAAACEDHHVPPPPALDVGDADQREEEVGD